MSMRIVFNGQEYSGPEDMPEEVRKAYEAVLAKLAESGKDGNQQVLGVQQLSILVNGRPYQVEDLPAPVRGLLQGALRSMVSDNARMDPARPEQFLRELDSVERKLGTLLQLVAAFAAGAVIAVGSWMIAHMDPGSRSRGGAIYVGIAMLIALAWAIGTFISAWRRGR